MALQFQTAVITNASSRHGLWSVQELAASARKLVAVIHPEAQGARASLQAFANVEIVVADVAQDAAWQSLRAQLAGSTVDVLIHAPPDRSALGGIEEATNANLVAPWLAAKYSYHLMREGGRGIVVIQAARQPLVT